MESIIVNAEVMCDLMHHCDRDLVHYLLAGCTHAQGRGSIDRDAVGQHPRVRRTTFRQRDAFIQPQQVRIIGWPIGFHDKDHIVDELSQFDRNSLEGGGHEVFKLSRRNVDHMSIVRRCEGIGQGAPVLDRPRCPR